MKVVTLNPPFLDNFSREARSPAVAKSGTLYYPMWLSYATGYLEKKGHDVKLIDAVAQKLTVESTVDVVARCKPDMVVVDTSTPSIYNDIEVAAKIKSLIPSALIVLVGPHVSACPRETLQLNDAVDAIATKEYDLTLAEIADRMSTIQNRDELLSQVNGVVFRKTNNTIIENKNQEFITDLNILPFVSAVYKKHLKIEDYFYSHSRYPVISLVTGRGCLHKCTYCVLPQTFHGHNYRRRSIANVVCEFLYIQDQLPAVKEIMLEDDTITADKDHCRELAYSLLEARATTIPWSANARAELDLDTLRLLRKAGCRLLCVGFESGEQNILNNVKKGTTLNSIKEFTRNAKNAGILVHGCFMVGNRGETTDTLNSTLKLAKKLSIDTAQFFPVMAYPGTSDFEYYKEKGWISTMDFRKWITPDGFHSSVVNNPDLTYQKLVDFCNYSRRSFYFRPGYVSSKIMQIVRHPKEAPRVMKAFGSLISNLQ